MGEPGNIRLKALIFSLVASAFSTIYITQPVLPVLQAEFGVSAARASTTVSAVILGIALANLPFGALADRVRVRPLILAGGSAVAGAGLVCAFAGNFPLLVAARFVQGLFLPTLTTCLVAYLVRTLPADRLNVVTGSYVSATVLGGLGGRLLGGWIHTPAHWRYAFVTTSVLLLAALASAARWLPESRPAAEPSERHAGFLALARRGDLLRTYAAAFGAFFVFSSVFNYLPFYLTGPPFGASTNLVTMMYLSYLVGVAAGPSAGRLSDRIGNGGTMILGSAVFAASIGLTFLSSLPAIAASLAGVCAGFFAIHSAAAGSLNRRLSFGRGKANALYVLFYYLGGTSGITAGGHAYHAAGWRGVASMGILMLSVPLAIGILEMRETRRSRNPGGSSRSFPPGSPGAIE